MSIICFQINQIPDLTLKKYQSLADVGIEGVLKRHESFLRQWHGISMDCKISFHLVYVYLPSESIGERLKIFFLLQGNQHDLKMVEPLLKTSPLSDFFIFDKGLLPDIEFLVGATLIKKERIADIYNPMTGRSNGFHYVPKWKMNKNARLYDLFRIMETIGQAYEQQNPCTFRIDLYPVSLALETRNKLSPILKSLRGENDIKLIKEIDSVKADSYAQNLCNEYEDWITNIETTPHFRVNIYGFADSIFKAKVILNAAGSEGLSEGDFSIASIKPDADGTLGILSRMGIEANSYCFYPKEAVLKSWSTTYCLSEVIPFFRFPVLFDGENIEISKETAPVQNKIGIYLGKDMNGYPVNIMLEDLPKHAFFTGMPGSGKTNTMLHLATQLRKHKIPFLALEPAKKEYRALLGYKEMQGVYLFSPHLQSCFPLQMNPMEFPRGVRLSEHINALMEVFEGSFALEGPTYRFLSNSIQCSYTDLGWDIEDENDEKCELPFPMLQDVYNNLQKEIDESSYNAELKGDVRAFLQVRLGGLMERDAGELFNVQLSTIKPEEWINISAIVELEVLGEQVKNFFVLLVCHYIVESLHADTIGTVDDKGHLLPVRHVLFIEEAHNIIAPSTHQIGIDSIDPKISSTTYIVKMLAEVRALREAIIIADQLPTALASEVTKNTGMKLVHRLTSQDDREKIGAAISASPLQLEQMTSFTGGEAFIFHERTMKPFEMQVAKWILPEVSFNLSDDGKLYSEIWQQPQIRKSVSVAFKNWQRKYLYIADEKLSALQMRYINAHDSTEVLCCIIEKEMLLIECKRMLMKCDRLKRLWILPSDNESKFSTEMNEIQQYIEDMIKRLDIMKLIT